MATATIPSHVEDATSIEPEGRYEVINGEIVETPRLGNRKA